MNVFHRPRMGQAVAKDRRAGFSLIELLTVIAIIAILAAVLFPVVTSVRVRAQHSQLVGNMKQLHAALGIYKSDEHGYPPSLGPVTFTSGPGNTQQFGYLYPEWLKDRSAYHSPANEVENPDDLFTAQINPNFVSPNLPTGVRDPAREGGKFNGWNTMDGHVDLSSNSYVLHYSRFRTTNSRDPDYKRQLGFRNPPEDSVVTWNVSFLRDTEETPNNYMDDKGDLFVLFLNGTVKKFTMKQVKAQSDKYNWENDNQFWRLRPF